MSKTLKVKLLAPDEVGQTDYCEAISQVARLAPTHSRFSPKLRFLPGTRSRPQPRCGPRRLGPRPTDSPFWSPI